MVEGMRVHLLFLTTLAAGLSLTACAGNVVVVGPGFVKDQVSANPLVYRVPEGWWEDAEATKKAGLASVLLPAGKSMAQADAAITIAFQRKDATKHGLATSRDSSRWTCRTPWSCSRTPSSHDGSHKGSIPAWCRS